MIIIGDSFEKLAMLESQSVQCCVTSPPYWGLRDYGVDGQLGLEKTPDEYVNSMRLIFEQVKRVLKDDGTLWLNLGDSYARSGGSTDNSAGGVLKHHVKNQRRNLTPPQGLKSKDLVGIPWRVAFALQKDGWYLRQDIIWHKPNPMPESVRDRCTKAHEYIFLFSKRPKYYFDAASILEPFVGCRTGTTKGRGATPFTAAKNDRSNSGGFTRTREGKNKRSVWSITTRSFKGAHFATFPTDLVEPCILAGSRPGDTILDPFFGAGTTGLVAKEMGRKFIGIELNPEYAEMARKRIFGDQITLEGA